MKSSYVLLEDRLKGEYRDAFDAVEKYKFTNVMDGDLLDDQMMELLDQLLMAQENKEPASRIVGDNIEQFCRNFFCDYKMSNRLESFLQVMSRCVYIVFIFTGIECITELAYREYTFSNRADISGLLFGFCIGMFTNILTYLVLRPLAKTFPKVKTSLWIAIQWIVLAIALISGWKMMDTLSFEAPSWVILIISGAYIAIWEGIKAWNNKQLYGTLRAPKQEKIRFWDTVGQGTNHDLVMGWYKRFNKKNERLVKKGKEPLTGKAYLQKLTKDYNYRVWKMWTLLIFVGLTGLTVVQQWVTCSLDYEEIVDSIVFTITLVGVEGIMGYFTLKCDRSVCNAFSDLAADVENSGLSYEDYMEKMISDNE